MCRCEAGYLIVFGDTHNFHRFIVCSDYNFSKQAAKLTLQEPDDIKDISNHIIPLNSNIFMSILLIE